MTPGNTTKPRRKRFVIALVILCVLLGGSTVVATQILRYLDEPKRQPTYLELITLALDLNNFYDSHGRSPNNVDEFLSFASQIEEWPTNRHRPRLMTRVKDGQIEIVWGAVIRQLPKSSPAWQDVIVSLADPGRADRTWVMYRDCRIERLSTTEAAALPRAKADPESSLKRDKLAFAVSNVWKWIREYEEENNRPPANAESFLRYLDLQEEPNDRDMELADLLKSGRIKVNWGVRIWFGDKKSEEANKILVYAVPADLDDSVFIATTAGSSLVISRAEFDASPNLVKSEE